MLPSISLVSILIFIANKCAGQSTTTDEERTTVIVSTKCGKLAGFVHTPSGGRQQIDAFFGIPFAQPPLGNRRFEKSMTPLIWAGIRDAGEGAKPPACVPHARPAPEKHLKYGEDCLKLNIFAPHREKEQPLDADGDLFPVLFLIHGGAYEAGSSADYSNYDLLGARFVAKGLVLVSVQYRLGVLGFATTGDTQLLGNLGIWDQISALRWIKENIRVFGGDPERVTILGFSAGSGSVGLLSTTPAASDLFHQTVRMSGSMLSSAASGTFVPKITRALALALNCSTSSESVKECLQAKSIEEIFDGIVKIGPAYIAEPRPKFGPNRMDHELFPMDHPEAIKKLPPKRTMLGFAELDFLKMALIDGNSSVYALGLTDSQMENYGQADFEAFLRDHVAKSDYFGEEMARDVLAELLDFYVNKYDDEGVEEAQRDAPFFLRLYAMVCSDLMIVVPMLWECQISAGANWPVYFYEYKYANPDVFPRRENVHVAYHGYDHNLLFGEALIRNENDTRISAFLIDSIVNFVKVGDPSSAAVKWEPTGNFSLTDSRSISHMEIGAQPAQKEGMGGELRRLRFWMEIRQKYGAIFDPIRGIYGVNGANGGGRGRIAWPSLAFILLLAMTAKTF